MRKIILILSSIVASLALLLLLAFVALSYWFKPNTLIAPLSHQIQQRTGLVLQIEGKLSWHVFPRTSIVVEQLSLQPAHKKSAATAMHLQSLEADLELWPLITQKKVIINNISLDGLEATLTPGSLKQAPTPTAMGSLLSTATHPSTAANKNIRFNIKSIRISNVTLRGILNKSLPGAVVYVDQFSLQNLNSDEASKAIPIDLTARIDNQGTISALSLQSDLILDISNQALRASNLAARLNTLQLEGNLNITQITTAPQYQGQFTIEDEDVSNTLHGLVNKKMPFLKTLRSQFTLTGNSQKIGLSALSLSLNGQKLTGALEYNIQHNHLSTVLNAGTLYWPESTVPNDEGPAPASTTAVTAIPSALSEARDPSGQFSLAGQLQIQHITYNQLSLDNIRTQLHYAKHTFTLDPLMMTVLQGLYQGKVVWVPQASTVQVSGTLSHLDLASLQHYLGQKPSLTGLLNAKGALSTVGKNKEQRLAHLNGNLLVDIQKGTWTHLDMANILSFLNAAGSKYTGASGNTFSSASGHFSIRNGIATNPDFNLVSPLLSIKGNGSLNLNQQTLKYDLMLHPSAIVLQEIKGLSQWIKQDIPVTVKGQWDNPRIEVDQAALIKTTVQDQLDNTVKAVRKLIIIR